MLPYFHFLLYVRSGQVPLQVKKHSLFSLFSSVISTWLAMLIVWMASGVVMHMDIETQKMVKIGPKMQNAFIDFENGVIVKTYKS